jgi:chromosome segregation ATPase
VDADGVALAAIQGLKAEKDTEITALKAESASKDKEIARLNEELQELKRMVNTLAAKDKSASLAPATH